MIEALERRMDDARETLRPLSDAADVTRLPPDQLEDVRLEIERLREACGKHCALLEDKTRKGPG